MAIAYIGIGSNLGNRRKNCLQAIDLLMKNRIIIKKRSSMYETEPWGIKNQPYFINMVLEIDTDLSPKELLKILKNIENDIGREESFKWGPRSIDLDILLFDDLVFRENNLQIPHPLMHKRDFVLKPLCEIAPYKIHPVMKKKILDLLHDLESETPG